MAAASSEGLEAESSAAKRPRIGDEETERNEDPATEAPPQDEIPDKGRAEAEDEALEHLYYRKSMKGLSKLDIQKALGKLILKREKMSDDDSDIKKIDSYILQLRNKLKKV